MKHCKVEVKNNKMRTKLYLVAEVGC